MSNDARQSIKTVLLVAGGVAVVTALAWWSVMGMVFVVLAALCGLGVGWSLGYRSCAAERSKPLPSRRAPARPRGGKR